MYKLKMIDKVVVIIISIAIVFSIAIISINITEFIIKHIEIDKNLSDQSPEQQLMKIYVIDCDTELREGDIISARMYNPSGEWMQISTEGVEYQLKYGARMIECK